MNRFTLPTAWATQRVPIDIVGAGGTGSQFADQLASLETTLTRLGHPGFDVRVHDSDRVSASNVGRARYTASDVGSNKAILLTHRLRNFYGVDWEACPRRYDPDAYISGPRLIVSCVDVAAFRAALCKRAARNPTDAILLDCGNGETTGQVIFGHLNRRDDPNRLPNVFDLYPELDHMQAADAEQPSCSTEEAIRRQAWPVNRGAALLAADMLWSLFRNGEIAYHGIHFELNPFRTTPLPICPLAWAMYGYTPPGTAKPRTRKRKRASA